SLGALNFFGKLEGRQPYLVKTSSGASRSASKNQCADKGFSIADEQRVRERQFALSCLPNRAGKVNSFLRFSSTLRTSAITDSLHQQRALHRSRVRDVHSPGGVHAFLRVQHIGRRMLFIRFVNRAVQAVRRSRSRRAAAGKR